MTTLLQRAQERRNQAGKDGDQLAYDAYDMLVCHMITEKDEPLRDTYEEFNPSLRKHREQSLQVVRGMVSA